MGAQVHLGAVLGPWSSKSLETGRDVQPQGYHQCLEEEGEGRGSVCMCARVCVRVSRDVCMYVCAKIIYTTIDYSSQAS